MRNLPEVPEYLHSSFVLRRVVGKTALPLGC